MSNHHSETAPGPEFSRMIASAKASLDAAHPGEHRYRQCLVLQTVRGEEWTHLLSAGSVEELIDQSCGVLAQNGWPVISRIVCMWEGGALDVPCGAFLKALCAAHEENWNAGILLNAGPAGCAVKRIADIL